MAAVSYKPGDMVVEFAGEVISTHTANKREEMWEHMMVWHIMIFELRYVKQGMGACYMFRLDDFYVIDSTHRGNEARFVNHCCQVSFLSYMYLIA